MKNYKKGLVLLAACIFSSIQVTLAQQDVQITDESILFGDASGLTSNPKIIWDAGDAIFSLGGFTNEGIHMTTSLSSKGKIGINIKDDLKSQLTIKANSGNTQIPAHLYLLENNNSGFPNIRFGNSNDETKYWDVRANSVGSPARMNFVYNGGVEDPIMTIQGTNDRVGINDDTPSFTLDITHVSGGPAAVGGSQGIQIHQASGIAAVDDWQVYVSSTTGELQIFAEGVKRGEFDEVNGVYSSFSDRRLKENITPLDNQLEVIMSLQPKKYKIIGQEDDDLSYGLIAQDLLKVIPELVSETDEEDKYMSVSYSELIPVLISAIQEQQVLIESLKQELADVAAVKEEVSQLRAELATFAKAMSAPSLGGGND